MIKKNKVAGITLIELLAAVAILGVLSSLAVQSFQKTLDRNRLKEAAESLKSDFQLARSEAIRRSADVIVTRNTGTNGSWCYGYNTDVACDCTQTDTTAADYCALKIVDGSDFKQTDLVAGANTTFTFRRGTANSGRACFTSANYTIKVKISNAGRVKLCTHSDATAVPGIDACLTDNC